jgi:hypothetical protein
MPESEDECWGWSGSTRGVPKRAYLYSHRENGVAKYVLASRVSYEIHYGTIPEARLICHHCDNPLCTNPKHIYAGTYSQNARDARARQRYPKPVREVVVCKCGKEFTRRRGSAKKFCDSSCRARKGICSIDGCNRIERCLGLCHSHHQLKYLQGCDRVQCASEGCTNIAKRGRRICWSCILNRQAILHSGAKASILYK